MVLTNIALNHYLIFSKGWRISGAAIASTLSETVALLIVVGFVIIKADKQYYGLKPVFDWRIFVQLLRLSFWSMIHYFISAAPWFLFFIAVEHLGKNQLTIANILRAYRVCFL